ncbi:MAG TPA: mobile mystery protein B [Verrucomicrobiae bacterium]|jgi:Fic-DOC domain mobile mystery protein B
MDDEFIRQQRDNTPIAAEELDALIPNLASQQELNEWERENILEAEKWCFGRALKTENSFSEEYVRKLHAKMFDHTWKWAGTYRNTEKTIGVSPFKIREMLKVLLDDAGYWKDKKIFLIDELAVRFHHRLVSIHPFPNGNGRHARLMADILVVREGTKRFTWGKSDLASPGNVRSRYIDALKQADTGNIQPLLEFARQ